MKLTTIASILTLALPAVVLAQGPLNPPTAADPAAGPTPALSGGGAPQASMKTLHQIEPRTPISGVTTINTSGSYYLTGNLTVSSGGAITISADHVTLDLNGFTLSSTASPATGSGVALTGTRKNVTIKNGHIRGTTTFAAGSFTTGGFGIGINHGTATSANLRVSDISVHGVGDNGISLATASNPTFVVERCTVSVCGGTGILAGMVKDSAVDIAGGIGIKADIASHCSAESVDAVDTGSHGILTDTLAEHCRGVAVAGNGVHSVISISHCVGISTSGTGIAGVLADHCEGRSTSGPAGINLGTLNGIASFCRGTRNGGVAIVAFNAIGCSVSGSGTVNAPNKSLGTP